MIYLISFIVFSGVIFMLVGVLLLVEAKVVQRGDRRIVINDDEENAVPAPSGRTLLGALMEKDILLPSACGGKGTCGTCKCRVDAGGGDILPTELSHLNRREKLDNVRLACQVKVKADLRIRIPEEIFNIRKYTATVLSNENVATFIKELELELDTPEGLHFEAGAYVQIDIPEYAAAFQDFNIGERYHEIWKKFNLWGLRAQSDEPVFRAYSLANPPYEPRRLRFTIRIATPPPGRTDIPPGVGSSYLFNLKPGDRVTLSGPYGDFRIRPDAREMCYIGGGAGMAPLRSQILALLNGQKSRRRISFWYGARSLQELFYEAEFRELAERFPNFSFHVALSDPQPEDHWEGLTGYIHDCAYNHYLKDHEDPTEIEYYLCGPPPMIDAVINMLDSLGVEPEMIAYDKFS